MRQLALTIEDPARAVALKAFMLATALLFAGFVSLASAEDVATRMESAANGQAETESLVEYG